METTWREREKEQQQHLGKTRYRDSEIVPRSNWIQFPQGNRPDSRSENGSLSFNYTFALHPAGISNLAVRIRRPYLERTRLSLNWEAPPGRSNTSRVLFARETVVVAAPDLILSLGKTTQQQRARRAKCVAIKRDVANSIN